VRFNFNTAYRRTGTLWEGRYRAAPIDSEAYFLACCRYVELKAVRARMVRHPREYRWSSFRAHADGRTDPLVSDHPVYRALGRGAEARQSAYRALFRGALESGFVNALRAAEPIERRRADVRRRVCPAVRRSNNAGSGDSWRCLE
jgi:putative transposase